MSRKVSFAEGEYYHIYNRGVEKRDVFLSDADRLRLQNLLYLSNSKKHFNYRDIELGISRKKSSPSSPSLASDKASFAEIVDFVDRGEPVVAIGAYCFMPNHFHLLVKEIREGGISDYMQKITTAYTKFFNKKYDRVGALFQNTFKAEHADEDNYLKYLYAYIHLNPVKLTQPDWKETGIRNRDGALKALGTYSWSSYLDYRGNDRPEKAILSSEEFPEHFPGSSDFSYMINDWLEYHSEEDDNFGARVDDVA